MDKEKFLLCDIRTYTKKENETFYYLCVYSSYEILEKVYINKSQYDYILSLLKENKFDVNKCISREYNQFKKKFTLVYHQI